MSRRASHRYSLIVILLIFLITLFPITAVGQNNGQDTCPNSLPPQMIIGKTGRVIPGPGLKNRIRQQAATKSNQIGTVSESEIFTVLDGPKCADGYTWWQIDFEGVVGWTVQGDSQEYWIEPFGTQDSATPNPNTNTVVFDLPELKLDYSQAPTTLLYANTNMENFPGTLAPNWDPDKLHYLGELTYGNTLVFTARKVESLNEEIDLNIPQLVTFQGTEGEVISIKLANKGMPNDPYIGGIVAENGRSEFLTMPGYDRLEVGGNFTLSETEISLRASGIFTIMIQGGFYSTAGPHGYSLTIDLVQTANPLTLTVDINTVDLDFTELEVKYDQKTDTMTFLNTNMENFPGKLGRNWNSGDMHFHYLGEVAYGDSYKFTGREFTEFDSTPTGEMNIVPHLVTFQGTKGDVVSIELMNPYPKSHLEIEDIVGPSGGTDYAIMPGYDRFELGRRTQIELRETGIFTIRIDGQFYSIRGLSEIPSYTFTIELVQTAQLSTPTPAPIATFDASIVNDRTPHPDLTAEDLAQPLLPISGEWQRTYTTCEGETKTDVTSLYIVDNGRVIIQKTQGKIAFYSHYLRTEEGIYVNRSSLTKIQLVVRSPDFITSETKSVNCNSSSYSELINVDRSAVPEAAPTTPNFQIGDKVRFEASTTMLDEPGYASLSVGGVILSDSVGIILDGPYVNDDPLPGTTWWEVRVTSVIGDVTLKDEGWIPASVLNEVIMQPAK